MKPARRVLLLAAVISSVAFFATGSAWKQCAQLTVEERQRIEIMANDAARPGELIKPELGVKGLQGHPIYFPASVDCKAAWSIEPSSGVTMNSATGEFRIPAGAKHGQKYTIKAVVAGLTKPVSATILVFRKEENPLVGVWREKGGQEIQELVFQADGTFSVTRSPFEVYRDYWGTYRYDLAAGTLELTVEHGNRIPSDMVKKGSFTLDRDVLTLKGLYLGNLGHGGEKPKSSRDRQGHVFVLVRAH